MSISRYVAETEAQHQFKLFAGHLESKVSNKQFSDYIRHYTYVILLYVNKYKHVFTILFLKVLQDSTLFSI